MAPSIPQTAVFEMTDARWQALKKSGDGHKYNYGHAAVVSGPTGQGGAARLAARDASGLAWSAWRAAKTSLQNMRPY